MTPNIKITAFGRLRLSEAKFTLLKGLILLAVFFSAESVFSYTVYLRDRAVSVSGSLLVQDVGRISGMDAEQKSVPVNASSPYFLTRNEAYTFFQNALGEKPEKIYGRGTWILPLDRLIQGSELSRIVLNEISKIPGSKEHMDRISLRLEKGQGVQTCAGCTMKIHLPSDVARLYSGKRIISADIVEKENGREKILYRQKISVSVLKKTAVPVAVRDLYRGKRIEKGDFRMIQQEIDPGISDHIENEIEGRKVLNDVPEGSVLTHSSVQMLPEVRRGQSLEVVYQSGNMVLKCRSVASADGEVGDVIPVHLLLPSGKKTDAVHVRIVSGDTAVMGTY